MRPLLAAVLVTAVIAALAAGCSDGDVGRNEAAIEIAENSRVLIAERGDDLSLAEGSTTVDFGAEVKVLAGSATISLADGSTLEVRDGTEVGIGTPISLVAADVLVTSGKAPVVVKAAGSQFTVNGVAKISRDFAVSASSYRGSVAVRSAARSLDVPALREVAVASLGVVPTTPEPLDYDGADPWDRRFLAEAIELGDQLEAKSTGFTESLGRDQGRTAGFYRVLLPELENEPQFDEHLLTPGLRPGEALVGATITLRGGNGSFDDRWNAVFGFRSQGARWGLVALDQQVSDTSGLLGSVNAAIGRQSFAFAPARQPAVEPVVVQPTAPAPAVTTPTTAPPAERPRAPEPTRTSTPPATKPSDPPLLTVPTVPPLLSPPDPDAPQTGVLEPLLTPVTSLLDGLLGGRRTP